MQQSRGYEFPSSENLFTVTLSFLRSTAFGDEIIFNGPMRLMAFGGNPVLQDLIDRVDRARRKD